MKNNQEDFISGIGNTPLIKLRAASEITGCNIYGKAEFLNPGGSVKDRAALALIKDAQQKKLISKGGIVIEGTAGNTGIGLGLLGNSLGYKTIIVMNDNQTQEKKDTLRNLGAELRLVPAKPYKDDNNFVKVAARLADELRPTNNNGVVWANQFDNTANAKGHYDGTGKEIWEQTEGKVDGFVCSSGTGGTISGVSNFLKEKNNRLAIEREFIDTELKNKELELLSTATYIEQRNNNLRNLRDNLNTASDVDSNKSTINEISNPELSKELDSIIKTRSSFDSFKNQFTKAFPNFFKTLINIHPTLSPTDLQLCAYIKMNQTNQDIASINNLSKRSVESQRYRLRKKLNIDKQTDLFKYLTNFD